VANPPPRADGASLGGFTQGRSTQCLKKWSAEAILGHRQSVACGTGRRRPARLHRHRLPSACAGATDPASRGSTRRSSARHFGVFRGNLVNVAEVRRLSPLPETALELCEVGHAVGGSEDAILLGPAAMETAIKRLSAEGQLAQYRVVHIASHGLVVGEIKGLAEPALVLSPPDTPAEEDDGSPLRSPISNSVLTG
jgi:CHAT domain-containing protein